MSEEPVRDRSMTLTIPKSVFRALLLLVDEFVAVKASKSNRNQQAWGCRPQAVQVKAVIFTQFL